MWQMKVYHHHHRRRRRHHHRRYHHQFLMPAIWRRLVQIHDLHYSRSFVKSIAPLNISRIDSMSSLILSIQRSLGLPLFHFPQNLSCSALCGIQSNESSQVNAILLQTPIVYTKDILTRNCNIMSIVIL